MNSKLLMTVFALTVFCAAANAQTHQPKHRYHKATKEVVKTKPLPGWAAAHKYDATTHAYFPDYYTYYDPNRGGYMYWDKGGYVFTPALPPFMEHADLDKSRVQLLKGVSLDLHPERNYPHYMKLYPAVDANDGKVPVPIPGTPGN